MMPGYDKCNPLVEILLVLGPNEVYIEVFVFASYDLSKLVLRVNIP